MKKIVSLLLVTVLLLSGCGVGETENTSATGGTGHEDSQCSTTETKAPMPSLMDDRQAVGNLNNTWYIPNTAVEDLANPEVCLWGDSLLFYSNVFTEGEGNRFTMKRISIADGSLLAETSFPCGGFVTLQTGDETAGICDNEEGVVKIFDGKLTETASYPVERRGDGWYLSRDMKRMYILDWQNGISFVELASGTPHELFTDARDVFTRNYTQEYLIFSYIDAATQKTTSQLLDLENGTLESLPTSGDIITAARVGGTWLICGVNWGEYQLVADGNVRNAVWQENRFDLLAPKAQLLTVDTNGSTLCVYDTQGKFLSKCVLPGEGVFAGRNQIWSDLWGGYFFLSFESSPYGKLMFWDTDVPVSGEDFPLRESGTQGGSDADPALYEKAERIGEEYGVEIRIADQCQLDYGYYDSAEMTDSEWITNALDTLTRAFDAYPDGFLMQLTYGNIQKLRIELVGDLLPKPGTSVGDTAAAFAQEMPDYYLIVFDVYSISDRTVYHEITHVTDKRLAWDASLRENALFSEETWMTLNPEGFQYAYTYGSLPDSVTQYGNTGCFASDYSLTYPTEDRATMMETAMSDDYIQQDYWAGLLRKLDYYSRCIRDCFDTTGWPETTAWEAALN